MAVLSNGDFLSTRDWHNAAAGGKNEILRRTSTLEYLQLFGGYVSKEGIDVYALVPGNHENVSYHIV
ncbi:MAG: hypothetical protein LBP22_17550 [Deltaproteobacteria bacterium]|jgi:hypothetical protein|nr:hypothetical protein [Deltaproteobacteria bacterium]